MVKVTNLTDRVAGFLHWRVMPKSSVLRDPRGAKRELMPAEIAYSSVAKHLADQGVLELEGYHPQKAVPVKAEAPRASVDPIIRKKKAKDE